LTYRTWRAVKIHVRRWPGLESECGWCSMPGCWYGPKLSSVGPQPGHEVGDIGAFGGGRGEKILR